MLASSLRLVIRGNCQNGKEEVMSNSLRQQRDWTKPAAIAIPKGAFFLDKVEQGR